jgi:signal transduction histidine kinase
MQISVTGFDRTIGFRCSVRPRRRRSAKSGPSSESPTRWTSITGRWPDTRKMLAVTLSKKAVVKYRLAPDLPSIQADASQIHQVLLNLVINASDALGENSGAIAIATEAILLNDADCAAINGGGELQAGTYVCLEVTDIVGSGPYAP